jgi:hypothetical protein
MTPSSLFCQERTFIYATLKHRKLAVFVVFHKLVACVGGGPRPYFHVVRNGDAEQTRDSRRMKEMQQ